MIAYNRTWLSNLAIEQEATAAYDEQLISSEELKAIGNKYPVGFYTPNPFIRTGLFILTVIIASFALGLLGLILISGSGEDAFSGLLIFFSVMSYIALEIMVQSKFHYRSGVDDALMCMTIVFLVSGVNILGNISASGNAILITVCTLYMAVRFADMLMTAIAFLSALAVLFLLYTEAGTIGKATVSFALMAACLVAYFTMRMLLKNNHLYNYHNAFTVIEFLSLICLYVAGNYFVVRETGSEMYDVELKEGQGIPFGWLFWMFTLLIPVVYIATGIYRKNTMLLRCGLLLVAFMVFTVRYYYSVLPMEVPMTLGGIAMIVTAWFLIRYLKTPKHGFTYKEASRKQALDKLNVEALIIAETMAAAPASTGGDTRFGGGSGGGGGATGDY